MPATETVAKTKEAVGPGPVTTPSEGRWPTWLIAAASGIIIPALVLLAIELILRLGGVGHPTNLVLPCTDHGRPAFCDNQYFTATFFPPGMLRTPRPYAIPAAKAPGTFRIFVLGESAAWGEPDPTFGFVRYLEVVLRASFPSIKFEIINTGTTAIDSHVMLPIARDLAQHQPDLFLLYAGSNEVVGPYGPGTVLTSESLSLPIIRTKIFFHFTRMGQLVAKASSLGGQSRSQWKGMEMFMDQQVPADSPQLPLVYRNFSSNLHDIIAVAHKAGAQVLLSTIATNVKDCAPFASLHRQGVRPEELQQWDALLQKGEASEKTGSPAEALKAYLAAAAIDSQYAELQFRIARCLWATGDFDHARQRYLLAQELDTLRFRADHGINEAIRSAAANGGPGVELLDTNAIFAQNSEHGVPGSNLFYEHVHMNPAGNYLIARSLFSKIAAMLPKQPETARSETTVLTEEQCERLLALTAYDRARILAIELRKMQHPPFTNQLNHDDEVSKLEEESKGLKVEYDQTLAEYQWAIMQNPDDRLLHLNYGFFLHRYVPDVSEQQLRIALPYDNAPVLCNWRIFD
jgi:tetratricopeptide (TPR) repeat protein